VQFFVFACHRLSRRAKAASVAEEKGGKGGGGKGQGQGQDIMMMMHMEEARRSQAFNYSTQMMMDWGVCYQG